MKKMKPRSPGSEDKHAFFEAGDASINQNILKRRNWAKEKDEMARRYRSLYILNFENKPRKLILSMNSRKHLWLELLERQKFDDIEQGKLWLLTSGAANMISYP